jgi:hypothetical protein
VADLFGPMPYTAMQGLLDPLYPRGLWNYFRSAFFDDLDGATSGLVREYGRVPNPLTEVHVHHLGGAMARVPSGATAFGTRDQEYILNVVARSTDADGYPAAVAWAKGATDALGPDAPAYVNFTGEGGADRVQASYPKDTYERLVAIKDRYDPANLFRLNQNIPPSTLRA